jgi:hypothetical protein
MKLAITGTSQGLGQHLKQVFEQHGHEVLEFNRSNGYDIKQPRAIVDAVQDCELFINNAYDGYGQVDLLYALVNSWEHKENRFIINIGSEQTRRWSNHMAHGIEPFDWREGQRCLQYRSHKTSLTEASHYLYQVVTWPQIMLVDIGMLDTQPAGYWSKHRKHREPVRCEDAAQLIYRCFDQRDLHFVSELAIRPLHFAPKNP